jgi:hypothetical protein
MTKERIFIQKALRLVFWPFRHWRITVPLAVLAIIAMGGFTKWNHINVTDKLEATGVSTSYEDLNLPVLTAEENAADEIFALRDLAVYPDVMGSNVSQSRKRLHDELQLKHRSGIAVTEGQSIPLSKMESEWIEQFLDENESLFDRLETALTLPGCQFGEYPRLATQTPAPDDAAMKRVMDGLAAVREMARWASLKSLWAFSKGNTEEAVRWNLAGLRVANLVKSDPILISSLVHIAITRLMIADLPILLSEPGNDLDIWADTVDELSSLGGPTELSVFLKGELCFMLEKTKAMAGNENLLSNSLMVNPTKAYAADVFAPIIQTLEDESIWFYRYYQDLEAELSDAGPSILPGRTLAETLTPGLVRALWAYDIQIVRARQAILGIELARYKSENGAFPESIDSLQTSIENVTIDRFSNHPFKYQKLAHGYQLYSFGSDGDDDGGEAARRVAGDLFWTVTN